MNLKINYHIFKKFFFYLFLFQFIIISGCQIEEVLVSTEPQFIVDSFLIRIDIENYPGTDKLMSYISFKISYHFENCSGSPTWYTFKFIGYDKQFDMELYPGGPSPADTIYTWGWDYWCNDIFSGKDYITINTNITGFIVGKGKTTYSESFEWNKDIRAIIFR
jgi:hypothetical protein